MNFSLCVVISILLPSICTAAIQGENANSKKKSQKKEEKLFVDDTEGSGLEPDTKTDMVYSGSGYGPDDEDAPFNPSPDVNSRGNVDFDEKTPDIIDNHDDNDNNKEDRHEQTLPMPVPKSTASPSTTTRAPEPPSIEVNTKSQESEIVPKVVVEKHPSEPKTDFADKSPVDDNVSNNNGVYVVNTPNGDRTTSFFAQPGILAAVIGGAVVGLLCAILIVMFIVYRMRKKDEGSYPLEEMKRCPATNPYIKPNHREFFA